MVGVILCGGQSSRMGTDKGLLVMHSTTWAQAAFDKMSRLGLPVLLSVNDAQYKTYGAVFSPEHLVSDNAAIEAKGPLRGILSIHTSYPSEDLFVLACDMPLMETTILQRLLDCYNANNALAYVYTNDGVQEPLCGIYTALALSNVLQLIKTNQLVKHSMKFLLEHVHTFSIPLAAEQKIYFGK